jgi:hypothetical protein
MQRRPTDVTESPTPASIAVACAWLVEAGPVHTSRSTDGCKMIKLPKKNPQTKAGRLSKNKAAWALKLNDEAVGPNAVAVVPFASWCDFQAIFVAAKAVGFASIVIGITSTDDCVVIIDPPEHSFSHHVSATNPKVSRQNKSCKK